MKRFILFSVSYYLIAVFTLFSCSNPEGIDNINDPYSNGDNSYTITYDGNGNTGGSVPTDSTSYEEGSIATVLGNTGNLVRTGYTFAGWNTDDDGSGTDYVQGATFIMDDSDITLYAKWIISNTIKDHIIVVGGNEDGEIVIKKYDPGGIEDTDNWNKVSTGITGDGEAIAIDSENNVYIAAYRSGNMWIRKFDANGNEDTTNWGFHFSASVLNVSQITVDSSDNVYLGGWAGPDNTKRKWIAKKYSKYGTERTTGIWNDAFDSGGTGGFSLAFTISCDTNDKIYFGGRSSTTGSDADDKWLIKKFNTFGSEILTNWPYFDIQGLYHQVKDIAFDSSNNVYAVGMVSSGWLIKKFSSDGVDANLDVAVSTSNSYGAVSIDIDATDNVFVLGYDDHGPDADMMLKKYDSSLTEDETWNKITDSGAWDRPHQVAIDTNGNVYITGHIGDGYIHFIRKYNSDGSIAWEKATDMICRCGNGEIQNIAVFKY